MTFKLLQVRLLEVVQQRVHNGELTERSLARLTGISQPHIHNVLKGVRILTINLADEIMAQLKMNIGDLIVNSPADCSLLCDVPLMAGRLGTEMTEFEPARIRGSVLVPVRFAGTAGNPVMAFLGRDEAASPRFEEGDLVLIDQTAQSLAVLVADGVYVVAGPAGPRLRYLRAGAGQLFLASERSRHAPWLWEALDGECALGAVKGRVVWVSRKFEV